MGCESYHINSSFYCLGNSLLHLCINNNLKFSRIASVIFPIINIFYHTSFILFFYSPVCEITVFNESFPFHSLSIVLHYYQYKYEIWLNNPYPKHKHILKHICYFVYEYKSSIESNRGSCYQSSYTRNRSNTISDVVSCHLLPL